MFSPNRLSGTSTGNNNNPNVSTTIIILLRRLLINPLYSLLRCDIKYFIIAAGIMLLIANLLLLSLLTSSSHSEHYSIIQNNRKLNGINSNNQITDNTIIDSNTDIDTIDSIDSEETIVILTNNTITKSTTVVPIIIPTIAAATADPAPAVSINSIDSILKQRHSLWSQISTKTDPVSERCLNQFSNSFITERINICKPDEADNNSNNNANSNSNSQFHCIYSGRLHGSTCSATNLIIDSSLLTVSNGGESIESVLGRSEEMEFPIYKSGAFTIQCQNNNIIPVLSSDTRITNYLNDMLNSIKFINTASTDSNTNTNTDTDSNNNDIDIETQCSGRWITRPALIVTRYEYANLYHTMGDWFNTYQAENLWDIHNTAANNNNNQAELEFDILFFDGHSQGILDSVWYKLFPTANIRYIKHYEAEQLSLYNTTKFCYRRVIFINPQYSSPFSVQQMNGLSDPTVERCKTVAPQLIDFIQHFIHSYGLSYSNMDDSNTANTAITTTTVNRELIDAFGIVNRLEPITIDNRPLILLILRRDYRAHPRQIKLTANRKLSNENELLSSMKSKLGSNCRLLVLDFAKLTMEQQLLAIIESDLIISIHGAALTYSLQAKSTAIILELMPPEFAGRPHYKFITSWSNHQYIQFDLDAEDKQQQYSVSIEKFIRLVNSIIQPILLERNIAPEPAINNLPIIQQQQQQPNDNNNNNNPQQQQQPQQQDHHLCIIIPFRDSSSNTSQGSNRTANLNTIVPYLIKHLSASNKLIERDFEILVIEQSPGYIFNKGALFNIGYKFAINSKCDYLVLHDVDQLPLNEANDYSYPNSPEPIHLCSSSSQYNFNPSYGTMVGGALAITIEQYQKINGYSNYYWGWGQEDDDLYARINRKFGKVNRLDSTIGRYQALTHPRVVDLDITPLFNKARIHLMDTINGKFDIMLDGISNLKYQLLTENRQYNNIRGVRKLTVELQFKNMPTQLSVDSATATDSDTDADTDTVESTDNNNNK